VLKMVNWLYAFLVAGISDAIDFVGFGWLPIIGDVLDIATSFILYRWIGYYAIFGAGELVPIVVGDLLPLHTGSVMIAYVRSKR